MPQRSSTTTLRHTYERAPVLRQVAVSSVHRSFLHHSTLQRHLCTAETLWTNTPPTQLEKIHFVQDWHTRCLLGDKFRNLKPLDLSSTEDTSDFGTTPATYKEFSFLQLTIVYAAVYSFLGSLKNPFLHEDIRLSGPGRIPHLFLDDDQLLSCVCKMNMLGSAFYEKARWSPFQLICYLAKVSNIKLVPASPSITLDKEDPQTWAICFDSWGHISQDTFWEVLRSTLSPALSFMNKVLEIKVSWLQGNGVVHGSVRGLLYFLAMSHFLDSLPEPVVEPLIDEFRDERFLPMFS